MIIGKGLVANAFEKYRSREDIVIFASGVSNSFEQNSEAFLREEELLKESLLKFRSSLFVYFGTCSVYDPSAVASAYDQHKLKMEKIVREIASSYIIFRLPQIVGRSKNNSTLLNYLYDKIASGKFFELWDGAVRYLVDIDDVVRFVSFVIDDANRSDVILNFYTVPCKVLDIVTCLETIVGRKAVYKRINRGLPYSIPLLESDLTVFEAGIVVDEHYVENVLFKYYKV